MVLFATNSIYKALFLVGGWCFDFCLVFGVFVLLFWFLFSVLFLFLSQIKSANHFFGEPEIVFIPVAFSHSLMLTGDMQHS